MGSEDHRGGEAQHRTPQSDQALRVQLLLDELCAKLGFCLAPAAQRRLCSLSTSDVDTFTDAVLDAEGLDPRHNKQLRRTVRDTIEWHMRRWA